MTAREHFDAVVIGGGSSGCALAARLTEDPAFSVLLLEAGPWDWNPLFHIPLASGKALREGWYGWQFEADPDEGTGGRALPLPRGRVMGGSSSINGMVYIRGHAADFDAWASMGAAGWSYADVLPAFRRSEGHASRSGPYHGTQGPLGVSTAHGDSPVFQAFIDAGIQAGFPANPDFNGESQEGFGLYDFTIRDGRRSSSSTAFLRSARRRKNLVVRPGCVATRLRMAGDMVTGVEYVRGSTVEQVMAGEVCVCAGSIKSPQLLMLSGIGEPVALEAAGVAVRHDLPGVGCNLQDHVHVPLQFGCPLPVTTHALIRADRITAAMLQAVFMRTGPATQFPTQAGGFTRSDGTRGVPDLQYHLINALGLSRVRIPGVKAGALEREGFTVSVCLLRPRSTGQVGLRSNDPLATPRVRLDWFNHPEDMATLVAGIEQARCIAAQPALRPFISECLNLPSTIRGRKELDTWTRAHCGSVHHQVGTCRMGDDAMAVTDSLLRVRGLKGVRVADASAMPTIVRGNTNAAAIMVAERAAEFMRAGPHANVQPHADARAHRRAAVLSN